MKTTGKLVSVTQNVLNGKLNITFEIDTKPDDIKNLSGKVIDLTAGTHRNRRSLDANAYFHVLVGKIAAVNGISIAHAKNIMIARYGVPETMEDGTHLFYKTNAPWEYMRESESLHSVPVRYEGNATFYRIMRGTHTYDSKEMANLINGTVLEAKDLGIETETPDEIERMVQQWGRKASSQQTSNIASYAENLM